MEDNKELLEEDFENNDCEVEELTDTQQAFDELSLVEEMKRIEKQDSKLDIPKDVMETDVFKSFSNQAYAIANGFRILLNAGVDYNNALSIISNTSVGYDNREMTRIQAVQVQQQMV